MGKRWRKLKLALGLNICAYSPRTLEELPDDLNSGEGFSDVALLSPANWPATPTPTSKGLRLSSRSNKSSKMFSQQMCSICMTKLKDGRITFTAECSHCFHFDCFVSGVKNRNQICPVCGARWTRIPIQHPALNPPFPFGFPHKDAAPNPIHYLAPLPRRDLNKRHIVPIQTPEPFRFDDDEQLEYQPVVAHKMISNDDLRMLDIKLYPEVPSLPKNKACDTFDVLVHLKAAAMVTKHDSTKDSHISRCPRAPVDLVTVLDVSGSMAGTKLALLKRAMGFVIQTLGSNDRLSVISFSSTARRLFPLCRMSETGRQQALQAVNSLVANGGTNIAEGLRKGAKVMEDRRNKNAVSSIILFSDGQDTYTVNQTDLKHKLLLPLSMQKNDTSRFQIPVHTFGFGSDHDASSMHSISEISGGTFSFIESECVIQDALAQCVGGLLSVAMQELRVGIEGVDPSIRLRSIKAGSYPLHLGDDGRSGCIDVGDLYADEERDFLVSVSVPKAENSEKETRLLKLRCVYKDPLTKEAAILESSVLCIQRSNFDDQEVVSVEVDRQRNRFLAAEAIAQARSVAEQGDLTVAVSVLEDFRRVLSRTVSAKTRDKFSLALDTELKEMQERMKSRHVYEASGRAYILSGLSSHSWQRATSRGDSTDGSSLFRAYQTPSMAEMLRRSQAVLLGSPLNQRLLQPLLSPVWSPKPR